MEKKKLSFERKLPLNAAISYLEEVIAGLRAGTLSVARGADAVVLKPQQQVLVEIDAKQ